MGFATCNGSNVNQQYYYNDATGQLYNVGNNQCFDTMGSGNSGTWKWNTCGAGNGNQRFNKWYHNFQWRDQNCIDVGNVNHNYSCGSTNNNQSFALSYFG